MKKLSQLSLCLMMLSFTSFNLTQLERNKFSVGMIVGKVAVQSLEMNPVGKGTNSPVGCKI
jgi:hypothetical protein